MPEATLRRRLRSALIVAALLVPTSCAFPFLAFTVPSPWRWLILGVWSVIAGVLGVVVARIRGLLEALAPLRDQQDENPGQQS